MVRDARILDIDGSFRIKLTASDVNLDGSEVQCHEYVNFEERVFVFLDNPVRVPVFSGRFNWSMVRGGSNPFEFIGVDGGVNRFIKRDYVATADDILLEVIDSFTYINPSISRNTGAMNDLALFIFNRFIGGIYSEELDGLSDLTIGSSRVHAIRKIKGRIYAMDRSNNFPVGCAVDNKITFYVKDSKIPSTDKVIISNSNRRFRVGELLGELIHEATLMVRKSVDRRVVVKMRTVRVHSKELREESISRIYRHTKEVTHIYLAKENRGAFIIREGDLIQFENYKDLINGGVKSKVAAKEVGINLNIASRYNKHIKRHELM